MQDRTSLSVAVLGASDHPDRYSFKAVQMLLAHGHEVYPVSPRRITLMGLHNCSTIAEVPKPVHTVTVYVNPMVLERLAEDILAVGPERIIFNPGTEHQEVEKRFRDSGIRVVKGCTLVLLQAGRFSTA